jgi:hypothetical protein
MNQDITFGENLGDNHRVGIAIGNDRENVSGNAEGLENGLVKGHVTVVASSQGPVDIEE